MLLCVGHVNTLCKLNRIEGIQSKLLAFMVYNFTNYNFNLISLEHRRRIFDLLTLFKIVNSVFDASSLLDKIIFRASLHRTRSFDSHTNATLNRLLIIYNQLVALKLA